MLKQYLLWAIVGLGSAYLPSPAAAADVIMVPTSGSIELPLHQEASFDWSGFYAGVFSGIESAGLSGVQPALGVQAGVSAQFDFLLVGAEVSVRGSASNDLDMGSAASGQILGRAGLVVDDDVLVYAASGYGMDLGSPGESELLVGGGVELAVTNDVSVQAEYLHGFPLDGGSDTDQITLGANFHF
jgi:outer membrane immunogenic protein